MKRTKQAFHRQFLSMTVIAAIASLSACEKHEEPKTAASSSATASAVAATTTAAKPAVKTYDGPFGLAMGISDKEIHEIFGFTNTAEATHVYTGTPPKLGPGFTKYYVIATPVAGVCRIRAIKVINSVNDRGDQLKEEADNLASLMEEKYGKPSGKYNSIANDIYRRNPQYWMLGLKEKSVVYGYDWEKGKNTAALPNNIDSIDITVTGYSLDSGSVGVTYDMTNFKECEKEYKKAKASNL
ncbi:hypothetical protein H8L32_25505 [Undibacterium sp. CY18W]|uniref:Lipoprotein n=1 Tax=Undibacterium hunanense TaxID=2762292 RepID=A0ABR6ZYD7_9BURK|nr:hypothetical protein [Undibacterium hunanense]MBC3920847.1 hypothetical protein [Undibacterium hunanense]